MRRKCLYNGTLKWISVVHEVVQIPSWSARLARNHLHPILKISWSNTRSAFEVQDQRSSSAVDSKKKKQYLGMAKVWNAKSKNAIHHVLSHLLTTKTAVFSWFDVIFYSLVYQTIPMTQPLCSASSPSTCSQINIIYFTFVNPRHGVTRRKKQFSRGSHREERSTATRLPIRLGALSNMLLREVIIYFERTEYSGSMRVHRLKICETI